MLYSHAHTSPSERASRALEDILATQWEGAPAVRIDSPPGAGKTGVVERLAAQSLGLLRERCMIATTTNEQCFDLARRLGLGFPRMGFILWVSKELDVPRDVEALQNLMIVTSVGDIPQGPCVVLANAAKWSWIQGDVAPFDVLIVDEAFQLPDYRFQLIAGLARRYVLVGDPGQIAPVIASSVERWRCDPAGPHVGSPNALVARHPTTLRLSLPVSRRLVPDTVQFVQPAFYPGLPFEALCENNERGLVLDDGIGTTFDPALTLAARGSSVVLAELPSCPGHGVDDGLAETIVGGIARLFERRARVREGCAPAVLTPERIGVVCAHVAQVNAVRERLPRAMSGVFVETAERFQGLERDVMFAQHPLSGREELDTFHLDAGRTCVMTTRHRVACFLVARAGIADRLSRAQLSGARVLGQTSDSEYESFRSHVRLLGALHTAGRVVRV